MKVSVDLAAVKRLLVCLEKTVIEIDKFTKDLSQDNDDEEAYEVNIKGKVN